MKHLLSLFTALCLGFSLQAAEIWVSPKGSDLNDGSRNAPKASLQSALRQVREYRRLLSVGKTDPGNPLFKDAAAEASPICINMEGGTYFLDETVFIRPEDSGSPQSPTIIRSAGDKPAILSGGIRIEGWQKVSRPTKGWSRSEHSHLRGLDDSVSEVWTAHVPEWNGRTPDIRQLYINGEKALKACDAEDDEHLNKVLSVNAEDRSITIPVPARHPASLDGVELFVHQMWEVAVLRVRDIQYKNGQAILHFHLPEARLEFEHPWPPIVISEDGNSPFRLSGAAEWMDRAGEWCYDKKDARLYYLPQAGQKISAIEAIVPVLENLVQVCGTLDRPVSHIGFEGIVFRHSAWNRPSEQGYVPLQAGMYLLDAYKLPIESTPQKATLENQAWIGRQRAAVELSGVNHTFFKACRFEHLGGSGLDYLYGNSDDCVEGCVFQDIAGSALVAGKFSDPGFETHLPYQPQDLRGVSTAMRISNNYIHHCAAEYWGCVGILAGYVRDFEISHNEVCEMPYSGISVGWGWIRTANCMKDNRIIANEVHHFGKHNYSCGGLYTLSAQVGTVIAENHVHDIYHPDYVHDKTQGHYIYLDEASSWMTIRDNWCSEEKFGQNQPGMNVWDNNGPMVADSIRFQAGLENGWKHIKQ